MERRHQKKIGRVTSNKMQKTVVITVERQFMHPLYKKVVRRSKNFLAHDPEGECQPGDWVWIEETRPMSRLKRWRVVEVVSKGKAAPSAEEQIQ